MTTDNLNWLRLALLDSTTQQRPIDPSPLDLGEVVYDSKHRDEGAVGSPGP